MSLKGLLLKPQQVSSNFEGLLPKRNGNQYSVPGLESPGSVSGKVVVLAPVVANWGVFSYGAGSFQGPVVGVF